MGTSCANNKCYQGSGPILCPRLLAPGLGTPPPWATPPSSTCGGVPPVQGWQAHARADGTDGLHQPSFPEPRLSPPRRVRAAPQEPYQRGRGMRTPRPSAPAILRAGVCGGRGVSQTATHTYLQSHGWNKHVALETATAGASARSLECSSESADDNALYVRRFAAGRDPHSLFSFYELSRSAENPFTHAPSSSVTCRATLWEM